MTAGWRYGALPMYLAKRQLTDVKRADVSHALTRHHS